MKVTVEFSEPPPVEGFALMLEALVRAFPDLAIQEARETRIAIECLAGPPRAGSRRDPTRRYPVTAAVLAQVRALYEQGGIDAVTAGTGFSKSHGFKLLRRARQQAATDDA